MSEDANEFGGAYDGQQDVPAGPSLWHYLRQAREERGLSIGEVAHHLKLAPKQIEAIEAGDLARLPGATFARGFVRNYARFLQLDETPFLAALEPVREVQLPDAPAGLARMPTMNKSRFSSLPALLITLALLGVVIAGVYYGWFEQREESSLAEVISASEPAAHNSAQSAVGAQPAPPPASPVASSAPVPGSAPPASQPSQSAPLAASTAAAVAVAQSAVIAAQSAAAAAQSVPVVGRGQRRIVLAFEAESWVEVRDGEDNIVYSRLNAPGTTQEIQGAGPFSLVIGNAQDVRLTYNGKPVDLTPYTRVRVARLTLQ